MAPTTTTTSSPSIGFSPLLPLKQQTFRNLRLYSDIVLHLFVRLPTRTAIPTLVTRMLCTPTPLPCVFSFCAFLIYCTALTPPLGRFRTPFCTLHSHVPRTIFSFGAFALSTPSAHRTLFYVFCFLFFVPCSLFHTFPLASACPWTLDSLVCVLFTQPASSV